LQSFFVIYFTSAFMVPKTKETITFSGKTEMNNEWDDGYWHQNPSTVPNHPDP